MGLPEPPDNANQNVSVTESDVYIATDSDSDVEDQNTGYELIPLGPEDELNIHENNHNLEETDNEEEDAEQENQGVEAGDEEDPHSIDSTEGLPPITSADVAIIQDLWSNPPPENRPDIVMDPEKINAVISAMNNFTLPQNNIPEWAANVPEEVWKQRLMERLQPLN